MSLVRSSRSHSWLVPTSLLALLALAPRARAQVELYAMSAARRKGTFADGRKGTPQQQRFCAHRGAGGGAPEFFRGAARSQP